MKLMLLALATATPAAAQDVLGPVNPVDYTGAITMGSAIEADAKAPARSRVTRRPGGPPLSRAATRTCEALPTYRAHLGARHPRIVQAVKLCRQVGFRY